MAAKMGVAVCGDQNGVGWMVCRALIEGGGKGAWSHRGQNGGMEWGHVGTRMGEVMGAHRGQNREMGNREIHGDQNGG